MRMLMHRYFVQDMTVGADTVLAAVPMPPGSVLNNVRGKITAADPANNTPQDRVAALGCHGYILPVIAPDTVITAENLWDTQVDKSGTSPLLDRSVVANTNAMYNPGEFDIEGLWGVGMNQVQQVYGYTNMFALPDRPDLQNWAADLTLDWTPMDVMHVDTQEKYRVEGHSMCVFGFSAPDFTVVSHSAVAEASPTETEWSMLEMMPDLMDFALMDAISLSEPGAESPFEDLNDFLLAKLETIRESSAGPVFDAIAWHVTGHLLFDVSLGSNPIPGTLSVHSG